ncbi:DUF1129 domain-containing protein [Aminipila terrae]|uniref:DUF1129 family protein n=1 Tax=Aminipila terrae TaxID=2697030 RepID=A0A6P1MHY9_9FIRM|nr:hypothetical protein [Aminipila terrae]QHI71608.1 hypothetical protein Ami3637_03725 [Aminipila terrae]
MNADELRKRNNQLEEQLMTENENKDMTQIVAYLRGSRLSEINQELVRQDILDIVVSARERGESMSQAIGSDYKKFCDDIIAEMEPGCKKEKISEIFETVFLSLSILVLIKMIFFSAETIRTAIASQQVNWNVPVSYLDIFLTIVIVAASWGIVEAILKDAFEENDKRTRIIVGSSFAAIIVGVSLLYALHIGSGILFEINLVAGYGLSGILYILNKVFNNFKIKK